MRWIRYSRFIAVAVLDKMEEMGLSQKELSERMGCSPQYVNKLVKGSENLTLETIAKLEDILDLDLVSSALSYVSGYHTTENVSINKVAEPQPPKYGRNKL